MPEDVTFVQSVSTGIQFRPSNERACQLQRGLPEGLRVPDAAATKYDIPLQWDDFDWNCDYYLKHETMMPEDWKDQIGRA
jgi:hypothetical protein